VLLSVSTVVSLVLVVLVFVLPVPLVVSESELCPVAWPVKQSADSTLDVQLVLSPVFVSAAGP
jgi:hypothetical protein